MDFCWPFFPFGFFFPLVSPWRLRYKHMAMGKAKTLARRPNGEGDDQGQHDPVVSPTDQGFGATGDERVVMHAGAVEGQPAFATEGVVDGPEEGGTGARIVTTNLARRMEKVSMSQAAWLKKR